MFKPSRIAAVACATLCAPGVAQGPPNRPAVITPASAGPAYADLVDLTLVAPVIADATIRSTTQIKGAEAASVEAGYQRLYIEADVRALVRGAEGIPPRIGYLLDVSPDSHGRFPKFKKTRVLVLARQVPGRPGQLQLSAPDAQLAWTQDTDTRVREIARAIVSEGAPPAVTGVRDAFHVPGALPGEGETQVFVTTADATPMSLSVLRRPGEKPRWAVALSEVVDEAAGPPARDTLLWYRLACGLPLQLPESATATLDAANADQARSDYAFVLAQLGGCGRTRD